VALIVLDATVVIGLLDASDTLHNASREALMRHRRDELSITASVYAEILVAPFRVGRTAVRKVDEFLAEWAIKVEPVTAEVARRAASMRARRRGLRLPDALVLAFADHIQADAVLTGDAAWSGVSRRVTVIGS
jgi:predicted nucleic acid-binding protein